jgi:rhamnulokinase
MALKTYLAVDLGAESGRVMAGQFDGRRVCLQELHRFGNGPVRLAGTFRWNLVGLWAEIQNGLRKAATEHRFGGLVCGPWTPGASILC